VHSSREKGKGGMKVYISFDIEGVSGIADAKDIDVGSPFFLEARRLATHDVNAAIEGALAGGATEILVNDGHGRERRNLLYEDLHPKAKLLRARPSTEGFNMAGFDARFNAVFFVGWHARPSSPGVLSHCFNSEVFTAWRVNGTPVGEPELAAALAGQDNVPLVLFTGDDCSCEEVATWCPDCVCVVTKQAIDRFSAICLPKEETYGLIKEGATRAVESVNQITPFRFQLPVQIEADILFDHAARAIAFIPGVEQISELTVGFESNDYTEAFRIIHVMAQIARVSE
jgi:D-amino peptidase